MIPIKDILIAIEDKINHLDFIKKKPLELYEPMTYLTTMGGKRTRPLLAMLAYYWLSNSEKKYESIAYQIAVAVELFHNFTLAHDDVMDNSPERRGKPTLHIQYDFDTAILAGDALFAVAYHQLTAAASHPNYTAIAQLFTNSVLGVCEGQIMDLAQAKSNEVSMADYIEMIRRKTAVLLGGAMGLGALIAEATDEQVHAIQQFAENIGIAFQLRDDYLDTFGDSKQFGKKIGGDIVENKKNFLWLKAIEKATPAQQEKLLQQQLVTSNNSGNNSDKIHTVTNIYLELGVDTDSLQQEQTYYNLALLYFEQLPQNEVSKQVIEMLDVLRGRQQ